MFAPWVAAEVATVVGVAGLVVPVAVEAATVTDTPCVAAGEAGAAVAVPFAAAVATFTFAGAVGASAFSLPPQAGPRTTRIRAPEAKPRRIRIVIT